MLLTNQKFGLSLGDADHIGLFCQVSKIETDGIEFRVINGEWDGFWKPNGEVTVYGPGSERSIHTATKWYLDPVPDFKRDNYNQALDWMNGNMTNEQAEKYCITQEEKDKQAAWLAMMDDDIAF